MLNPFCPLPLVTRMWPHVGQGTAEPTKEAWRLGERRLLAHPCQEGFSYRAGGAGLPAGGVLP